jgi:hypothetical protein
MCVDIGRHHLPSSRAIFLKLLPVFEAILNNETCRNESLINYLPDCILIITFTIWLHDFPGFSTDARALTYVWKSIPDHMFWIYYQWSLKKSFLSPDAFRFLRWFIEKFVYKHCVIIMLQIKMHTSLSHFLFCKFQLTHKKIYIEER